MAQRSPPTLLTWTPVDLKPSPLAWKDVAKTSTGRLWEPSWASEALDNCWSGLDASPQGARWAKRGCWAMFLQGGRKSKLGQVGQDGLWKKILKGWWRGQLGPVRLWIAVDQDWMQAPRGQMGQDWLWSQSLWGGSNKGNYWQNFGKKKKRKVRKKAQNVKKKLTWWVGLLGKKTPCKTGDCVLHKFLAAFSQAVRAKLGQLGLG